MLYDIRDWHYFEITKQRFLSFIEKTDSCWLWQKNKHLNGYGRFTLCGQDYRSHRMSYMLFNGPIPGGKIVRHTCDDRACVNPEHLILGTQSDNLDDCMKENKGGRQKLNSEAVKVIKWMLKYRPERGLAAKLARLHGVDRRTITDIKKRRTWHWIKV